MARDYLYDPGEDLDMPEYVGADTDAQSGWGTGLTAAGGAGMTTAGIMAATGVAAIPAGVVAGISGLAMLGGTLLSGDAQRREQEARSEFDKEMLEYQRLYAQNEKDHLEREAIRAARRDALGSLKSRNIFA